MSTGGYDHRIEYLGGGVYRVSWTYDTKHRRIRYPRTLWRETDRAGTERFAKKWGCRLPTQV